MTTTAGDALSHVVLAMILEGRFAAIAAVANRLAIRNATARLVARAGARSFPDAWAHEPGAGGQHPRTNQLNFRITCANLVAADENYIRRYFYLIAKLKFS